MSRLAAVCAGLFAVCWLGSAPALPVEAPSSPRGVVFVVGGIGGLDPLQAWAPWALPWAGVGHEITVFRWTHGICRPLRDLQDTTYLLARGGELADAVRAVQKRQPARPIYLIGHSAGTGVVLAAAENLPPASLERIILLSPAVSPTFDLCPALRACRGGIVSFNSAFDRFMLHWGTGTFGTVDRIYGPSAGCCGFQVPEPLDDEGRKLYDRLVQVPWSWERLLDFCGGLHNSTTMPIFLGRQVAPWLRP
jgi:pimeloyl-ACP methyl ester carboxylesterase